MLNFAAVKQIVIPEGNVIAIDDENNVRIWQAAFDAIVNGVSPLTLPSAVRAAVVYLKQQGVCEQNGTPTPTSPVDIKCNNGVIRIKDRELPYGYRRLLDITFDGDFYYNTGEKLTGDDDVTITLKNTSTAGQNVFGCYSGTVAGKKNFSFYIYGNDTSSNSYLRYGETLYRPNFGSGERTVTFGKNGTTGFKINVSITPEEFETNSVAYIGMLPNSSSPKYTGTIVGSILVSNRLKWIPCKRMADNVIGYYEVYTKKFIEKTGEGVPTTSGYDNTYYDELFIDGTHEILSIDSQTANVENLFGVEDYKDEQNIINGQVKRRVGVKIFNGNEAWIYESNYNLFSLAYIGMIVNGKPISTHFPYKTFTTTEQYGIGYIYNNNIFIKDTDFTTLQDFKAFLAAQYQAGTPVIVVYPLATDNTEYVNPQQLNTVAGNNTITVTAEVGNIPLEAKYKKH